MNIEAYAGAIQSQTTPPQGMTSLVVLLKTERGNFALKRSDRVPYLEWLKREAFVLNALSTTHLPIPQVIAIDEQPDSVSLLMTALPGEPLSELLRRGVSDEMRRDLLHQFGQTLSLIHNAQPPSILSSDRPWLQRILDEGRFNLEHGYAEEEALLIAQMIATCPATIPEVLIHGDYTIDNVLVDGGRITGIIDWGRGDIGDPRYDLTLATRPQEPESAFLDEADFVAFYAGYGGERLNRAEEQWFFDLYGYF